MRKKLSNKKCAVSLSTNAMVIIIISLVTIALMISFLSKITNRSTTFIDQNEDRLNEFFRISNCKDSDDFCVYPNVLEHLNKETQLSAILKNRFGNSRKTVFKITYDIINISGKQTECVRVLPPQNYNFSLDPNSRIKLNFVLRPNGSGNCLLKINISFLNRSNSWLPYVNENVYIYKN